MVAPICYPKLRGLQHHWNKVYSYRTLQKQHGILLYFFSSPLSLAFPSARAHLSWVCNFLVVPVRSALASRGCVLTFTSIPLPCKLLLAAYPLLEKEQKALVERNCHVYAKDPKHPGQAKF